MSANHLFALALSACALTAAPIALAQTGTGLEPAISQQDYNEVMYCIGRNEGEMDMTRRVAPNMKDPEAFMGIVRANEPAETLFKEVMQLASHPSNRLDLTAGEAERQRGRKIFEDHADNGSRAEYDFLVSNTGLTKECITALSVTEALLSAHAETREKLAAVSD